jgi:hypothetical protein
MVRTVVAAEQRLISGLLRVMGSHDAVQHAVTTLCLSKCSTELTILDVVLWNKSPEHSCVRSACNSTPGGKSPADRCPARLWMRAGAPGRWTQTQGSHRDAAAGRWRDAGGGRRRAPRASRLTLAGASFVTCPRRRGHPQHKRFPELPSRCAPKTARRPRLYGERIDGGAAASLDAPHRWLRRPGSSPASCPVPSPFPARHRCACGLM